MSIYSKYAQFLRLQFLCIKLTSVLEIQSEGGGSSMEAFLESIAIGDDPLSVAVETLGVANARLLLNGFDKYR